LNARWRDDGLEICRDAACRLFALPKPPDSQGDEVVFDGQGRIAVVPLGRAPGGGNASAFATLNLTTGARVAALTIRDRHHGAEAIGFAGPSLMVTDCDERATVCNWDLYDPRAGTRIAAVGGAHPLGAGGTAEVIDQERFAAVAGTRLVVQEAATGKVTASLDLPKVQKLRASYVVLIGAGGLVVPGPDGRVVLVDPQQGKITRTIMPPPCGR
jgi:hypothetical protein